VKRPALRHSGASQYPCENAGLSVPFAGTFFISLWIYTMNRCLWARTAGAAVLLCALNATALAQAPTPSPSGVRAIPATAQAATLRVEQPPLITLNGQADRLSPGARIYGPNRQLVLSASLLGQAVPVRYVRDLQGLVHEVWLAEEPTTAR
jgi:hypothetical protein